MTIPSVTFLSGLVRSLSFTVTGTLLRNDFGVGPGWLAWAASKEINLKSIVVFKVNSGG